MNGDNYTSSTCNDLLDMNGKHGGLGLLAEISLRLQNNSEYLSSNGSSMSLPTLTSYFNNSNDIDSLMVNSPSITPEVQCFSPTNMTVSTAHSIAHENDFLSPSDTTDSSSILWVNLKGQQEIQKNKNISEKLSPTGMIRTHGNLDMGSPSTSSKRNRKKCSEIVREFKCDYPSCSKAYGALKHLNCHRKSKSHGPQIYAVELKHKSRISKS